MSEPIKKKSIFVKKSDIPIGNFKIDYESVLETIPSGSFYQPQPQFSNRVEHRWRFLNLPLNNKMIKVIEISRKCPNEKREYLCKDLKWAIRDIDTTYDNFVIQQYYYYCDK